MSGSPVRRPLNGPFGESHVEIRKVDLNPVQSIENAIEIRSNPYQILWKAIESYEIPSEMTNF